MKKLTSMLLALLMVMTMVPAMMLSASAAGVVPSSAKEYNGHTYYLKKGNYTWTAAKKYCENRGGHLVTITSKKENSFVSGLLKKSGINSAWLGATDEAKEGTWKWITGEKFKYTAWEYGNPNNYDGTQHYLATHIDNRATWNDYSNDSENPGCFIIEWDMSKKAANAFRMAKSSASVYYGSTVTLKTLNASGKVTWKTSNKKVATVSSKGVVKGVALGTCTISATNGKKTVKCKVTVKDRSSSASVSFKVNGGGYFIKGVSTAAVKFKMKSYNCAKVTVYIRNSQGENVYKKTFSKLKKGTYYSFNWNGKNTKDKYVPAGSYRVLIVSGSKKTYSSYLSFKTKNDFAGGNGSKASPFLVASTSQLKKIVKYPTGYFKQTKNLNFDYTAVGNFFTSDQPFNGVYDGAKKTISNISANTALFNVIGEKGTVKNVVMKNCNIVGGNYTAILANTNNGKITNCNVNGNITYTSNDTVVLGFLALKNYGTITGCTTSGKIVGVVNYGKSSNVYVGGIVDDNYESGKLISCTSNVEVSGKSHYGKAYVGGVVAMNVGMVNDCEASGTVEAHDDYDGGIAGNNSGQIMSSYYTGSSDVEIAGQNSGIIA